LPVIKGHKLELRALFQNLLTNALKFRRKDVAPEILITAGRQNGSWLFKIQDNGIGIEAANLEKIFLIFKRLHNRSEIEGNGIGLAQCKKIVELHGGTIHVESVYGEGSTFIFTLKDME
jgi:light-regulated signal transduction histidine kinase (bacteriophytochrome)